MCDGTTHCRHIRADGQFFAFSLSLSCPSVCLLCRWRCRLGWRMVLRSSCRCISMHQHGHQPPSLTTASSSSSSFASSSLGQHDVRPRDNSRTHTQTRTRTEDGHTLHTICACLPVGYADRCSDRWSIWTCAHYSCGLRLRAVSASFPRICAH